MRLPSYYFRPATAEEFPLVFDSWARSFRNSPYAGCVTNEDWPTVSRSTMNKIIERGALVLCSIQKTEEGVERVAAYAVAEPARKVLHWVFTKKDFRGYGHAGALVDELAGKEPGWVYTYRTQASGGLLKGRMEHLPVFARTDP